MPHAPTLLPHARSETHSVGFTLAAIMLVVSLLGLAGAYGLAGMLAQQRLAMAGTADAAPLQLTLVGKQLTIPRAWLRRGDHPQGDFSRQVELRLALPLGRDGALTPIDVTLLPLSEARPSASLLDGVYLHQFMPNELSGPAGLVGKPLYATGGYANEAVWYDALSQNPFVAKCAAAPDDGGEARCLRTVALPGGIAAVYAFDAEALNGWRQFDQVMQEWLGRIGAL